MTRAQLLRELVARRVSPYSVYLDGVRDDGWVNDCIYVLEKPDGFEVGYQERNQLTPFGRYDDESAACARVFAEFAHEYHWPPGDPVPGAPVEWTADMRDHAVVGAARTLAPWVDKLTARGVPEGRIQLPAATALDAVPGRPELLRPAQAGSAEDTWHVLVEDLTVILSLDTQGDPQLRLGGGVNPVTIDELRRSGVLRRIRLSQSEVTA